MENSFESELLSFGEWVQQRRQAMGLTRADLAKKVGCAAVTIKKIEREERKPSQQIAELLADNLAIPDALRTEFIRMSRGDFLPFPKHSPEILRIPPSLQKNTRLTNQNPSLFVERQAEMAWLDTHLSQALAGNGLPVFILGDSGSGKTTLMVEFARRAQQAYPDLLVAGGHCNAQSGMGDPYRPFRDILGVLTGDAGWEEWGFSHKHALRIWSFIPDTVRTLTTHGPNLIDLILPATPLVQRIAPYLIGPTDWLDRLEALARTDQPPRSSLAQIHILEETTQMLRSLSHHHPLLLLLDDLQWVDDASKNLLYHFGRRLNGSRIMLVGACRPEENQFHPRPKPSDPAEEHSIQSLINELTRHYGDIQINLNQANPDEGWAFINALIDSESNDLDRAFRDTLFRYTHGHPLFSVEMLRHMQENHHLIRDDTGRWTLNQKLEVSRLPARIEAVIAQRLAMLPALPREMLNVASVEGDIFTAQSVSTILGLAPGKVLQTLSRELEGRHRLVEELGEIQVSSQRFHRFQFRHRLFQEYLYSQLGSGERRRLHRAVGEAFEGVLFAPDQAQKSLEISHGGSPFGSALVHHFWEGEVWEKAARYALQMGNLARSQFAMREAIVYFDQAILALDHLPGEADAQVYDAILRWVEAAYKFIPYDEQLQRLTRAENIARKMDDKPRLIQALHTKANVFLARGLWTRAGPALSECLSLSDELQDERLTVRPVFFKALMTSFADPPGALEWIDRALDLSRNYADLHIEASSFGLRGEILAQMGNFTGAQDAIRSARQAADRLASPLTELDVDLMAAWACLAMGEIEQALVFGQRSVDKAIATDNMDCICNGLACIGYGNLELHRIQDAASAFEKGIQRSEMSGAMIPRLNGQAGLAMTQFINGKIEAVEELEQVVEEMHRYQNEIGAANANLMLGSCFIQIDELKRAKTYLDQSVDYYRQSQLRPFLAKALFLISGLEEKQGKLSEAQIYRAEAGSLMQSYHP